MKSLPRGSAVLVASAWAGGMWATGYLAVPILFHALPDKMLAGMLAGQLFAGMACTGLVCGVYLLVFGYSQYLSKIFVQKVYRVVVVMLLLVLLGQLGLQPAMAALKLQALPLDVMHSEFAARFQVLHGMASILYLVQSLLAVFLVLKFSAADRPASPV